MNINFNILYKYSFPYLIVFIFVYIFNFLIFFTLPKHSLDYLPQNKQILKYSNYFIYPNFSTKSTSKSVQKDYMLLSNLTLSAVYAKKDSGGWIIVKDNNSLKTYVLQKGEQFKNYVLKSVFPTYVIFEKNNKQYKLEFKKEDFQNIVNQKTFLSNNINNINNNNNDTIKIKKSFFNDYVNDVDKIWKDIVINPIEKNNGIDGFIISSMKKNSVLGKIGLQAQDIIKKVNNVELNSYNNAFSLFKNIKNNDYINIEIIRNNKLMELNYEIN